MQEEFDTTIHNVVGCEAKMPWIGTSVALKHNGVEVQLPYPSNRACNQCREGGLTVPYSCKDCSGEWELDVSAGFEYPDNAGAAETYSYAPNDGTCTHATAGSRYVSCVYQFVQDVP